VSAPLVLVAGNPNAGKTTLFNAITGAFAKVGNYPGITVDKVEKQIDLDGQPARFVDLPGSYSLTARSEEERVAVEAILSETEKASALVVVADATTLRRGLYFATQVLDTGIPAVLALTMMDDARKVSLAVDLERLSQALGCPVVPLVAPRGEGLAELRQAVKQAITEPSSPPAGYRKGEGASGEPTPLGKAEAAITAIEQAYAREPGATLPPKKARARAAWALVSVGGDELKGVPDGVRAAVDEARKKASDAGFDLDAEVVGARYRAVDALLDLVLTPSPSAKRRISQRIDDVLVHPLWGLLIFAAVMFLVFQTLFAWATPFADLIESGVNAAKVFTKAAIPPGPFNDLVVDGVIAGVGNVLVFVPQIALLFVFLTILEDSGYLARVAFVIDRVMAKVGLNGRAFVPMLSGFACAIPAVMATRTIESRRDRLLTMLVVPLSSCSARLPVYVLLTAVVFDPDRRLLGFLAPGALALFAMYLLSVVFSLGTAFVIGRTVLKGPRPTLVLELPVYRMPRPFNVARATWQRVRRFLVDAGTIILALTIVLWGLLNYPRNAESVARFEAMRQDAGEVEDQAQKAEQLAAIDAEESGDRLRSSIAGKVGHVIEPAIRPLGFDWKIGVGILGAFAAREVFVSTLGLVYDVQEATEETPSLKDALRQAKHADGRPVFTPLAGVSLMVFFVLAAQCMSTLAVVKRESGSWKWAGFMFAYMSGLAYLVTLLVYQGGRLLGWGL
jgi:ferrous iron transport protein B